MRQSRDFALSALEEAGRQAVAVDTASAIAPAEAIAYALLDVADAIDRLADIIEAGGKSLPGQDEEVGPDG